MRSRKGVRVVAVLVLLLLIAAALVYIRYRDEIRAARARVAAGSQVVNTPCGPIEYAVAGSGPPVLVIHGAGGGFDQGLDFGRPLFEHQYQVIAPSRFGYLRTPLPRDPSPMAQADAHACLLDALHIQRLPVFGGSAGAPSAMQLCLRHPERCSALTLLVPLAWAEQPTGTPPPQPTGLQLFLIETTLKSDFVFWVTTKLARQSMVKSILATPPEDVKEASAAEQARARQVLRNIEPVSRRQDGLRNDGAIARSLPRYDVERITAPTLVISVEDDLFNTYAGARYTAEHIPGARFIGYRRGGHLWLGHQQEVWDEIAKFIGSSGDRAIR